MHRRTPITAALAIAITASLIGPAHADDLAPPAADAVIEATAVPAGFRTGYWMIDRSSQTYGFGTAADAPSTGTDAVAIATNATGTGLWKLGVDGVVRVQGAAAVNLGNLNMATLAPGEVPSALSVKPDGTGYWIFTNRGRAVPFGTAQFFGDLIGLSLNGPVVASVATPSGLGYYMIGSDGGVFALGDAVFKGSMGGQPLNGPVVGIAPDPDNDGYWLVADDGGIFSFNAEFKGSMGGQPLNKPMIGAVAYGDGYLMVAADGGIFNYSSQPFLGSLGATPPATPVVDVAAFASYAPGALDGVSMKADGTLGGGLAPDISADGNTVVFFSPNALLPGDVNGRMDIYAHHRITGEISLVSLSDGEGLGSKDASNPSVSRDGRYVVFQAPMDTYAATGNANVGIWMRDRVAGTTTLLHALDANGNADRPSISDDGNVVSFSSTASNLVAGDANASTDVFVWERSPNAVRRVSVTSAGTEAPASSAFASISGDGSTVAFLSVAAFVTEDQNAGSVDVYARSLAANTTALVSATPGGLAAGDSALSLPSLSADGTNVAFSSSSGGLVVGDTNAAADVFVRHMPTAATQRVSVSSSGEQGNGDSFGPSISANGLRVAFQTNATNLVLGDNNGDDDVVVRARLLNLTLRASNATDGSQLEGDARTPAISSDGRTVAFDQLNTILAKFVG
jgi:Tol biopolymer transport system component